MVSKVIEITISDSRTTHRQTCHFKLENGKTLSMENDKIFELTTVKPNELEVFLGSQIKYTGEGAGYKFEEFHLTASQLTSFRKSGDFNNTGFKTIMDIAAYKTSYNSWMFQLKTSSRVYDINYKALSIMAGIYEPLFNSLIGCYIKPKFFRMGEMMGKIRCQQDNKTIKDLNLRYSYKFPEKIGMLRMNGDFQEVKEGKFVTRLENPGADRLHSEYRGDFKQDQYGGPRNGYGGNLDDDFINDALDGDPEAYWNID